MTGGSSADNAHGSGPNNSVRGEKCLGQGWWQLK